MQNVSSISNQYVYDSQYNVIEYFEIIDLQLLPNVSSRHTLK